MVETKGRKMRGLSIVSQEMVEQLSDSVFVVKGSANKVYRVFRYAPMTVGNKKIPERWSCECWDYKARCRKAGVDCKHITASKVFETLHGRS